MTKLCKYAQPEFILDGQEDAKCGVATGHWSKSSVACNHPDSMAMRKDNGGWAHEIICAKHSKFLNGNQCYSGECAFFEDRKAK